MKLTQYNNHRNSKEIQSSSQRRSKPSTEDRQVKSDVYNNTRRSEGAKDKPTHKRKHDAYTQDDERRYSEISENTLHRNQADPNAATAPRSKIVLVAHDPDIVFRKV